MIFCKKIIFIYDSCFVTDSGGHPQGGSIQCGSKRRVALQFVIASVTSSVITLRARCQGNSCNCPGLGTRIPHATFYTIYYIYATSYTLYYICYIVDIIQYMPTTIHTNTMHTTFHLLYIILYMPVTIHTTHATYYIIYIRHPISAIKL